MPNHCHLTVIIRFENAGKKRSLVLANQAKINQTNHENSLRIKALQV